MWSVITLLLVTVAGICFSKGNFAGVVGCGIAIVCVLFLYHMFKPQGDGKLSITDLIVRLSNSGIDLEQWGKGAAKTVQNLLDEINSGESTMTIFQDKLIRKVRILYILVRYSDGQKNYVLKEQQQENKKTGVIRTRDFPASVAEKMQPRETSRAATIRAIAEELGIETPITILDGDTTSKTGHSDSYPGLTTDRIIYNSVVNLNAEQFNPDGYTEDGKTFITTFVWEEEVM